MSEAQNTQAVGKTSPIRLRDALRRARIEAADRTGVVVDLRDAEVARLEILDDALDPVFAQVPEQIDLFDGLPENAQLAFLGETVNSVSKATSTLDAMVAEWMKGDADGLAMLLNDDLDDPVLYKRLLTDRNARWAQWIDQRLKTPGTVFIAVGAGHLAGRESVQQQLKKRGIKARRLWQ